MNASRARLQASSHSDHLDGARKGAGPLVGVFVAAVATRLPFALTVPGIGVDPDAWRLLLAGRLLRESGQYRGSRPPTYPAMELVSAALAGAPFWAYVVSTVVAGAIGVTAFADFLRTLRVRSWIWPTAALTLTPVVFRADMTFMDYSWSLAATFGSFALIARSRLIAAGALFGLAVAMRPAAAVAVVVVITVLVVSRRPCVEWARFAVTAALVAAGFFALPALAVGVSAFTVDQRSVSPKETIGHLSVGVWGWLGSLAVIAALLVALARSTRGGWRALTEPQRTWVVASIVGSIAQIGLFLRLPLEDGYLCPLVPLVLIILACLVAPPVIVALAGALAVSAVWAPAALGTTVLDDLQERRSLRDAAEHRLALVETLPSGARLLVGTALPEQVARAGWPVAPGPRPVVPERVRSPRGVVLCYSEAPGHC